MQAKASRRPPGRNYLHRLWNWRRRDDRALARERLAWLQAAARWGPDIQEPARADTCLGAFRMAVHHRKPIVRAYQVDRPARWLVSADDRVVASLPADCSDDDLGAAMAHAREVAP